MTYLHHLAACAAPIPLLAAFAALVGLLEGALPLRGRGPWGRVHLVPNLALSAVALATGAATSAALVTALARPELEGAGILPALGAPPALATLLSLLLLDLAFYLTHVAMHAFPLLWRFHAVHHSDPAVDVTTSLRHHPVEGLLRDALLAASALLLGVTPDAFALSRALSAASALLEHADLRLPSRLDRWLSIFVTWPSLHKVHHSRDPRLTDTNFGNLVTLWDRLFLTFTPASAALEVVYGLDGRDEPRLQTTTALLASPVARGADAGDGMGQRRECSEVRGVRSGGAPVRPTGRRAAERA